ncbi:unnamed protein product [Boreogadus saida]
MVEDSGDDGNALCVWYSPGSRLRRFGGNLSAGFVVVLTQESSLTGQHLSDDSADAGSMFRPVRYLLREKRQKGGGSGTRRGGQKQAGSHGKPEDGRSDRRGGESGTEEGVEQAGSITGKQGEAGGSSGKQGSMAGEVIEG